MSHSHHERAARGIARTLMLAQSVGSAGLVVASTVAPLVGAQLGGSAAWAGVPAAMYQGSGAAAAFVWGLLMDRLGRRPTLVLGAAAGVLGATLASGSIAAGRMPGFLAGVALMGTAYSALQLGRFVAAEVKPRRAGDARSRRSSWAARSARSSGRCWSRPRATRRAGWASTSSGPFATSALLFVCVTGLLFVWLHPEPRELARTLAAASSPAGSSLPRRSLREILAPRDARLAVAALVLGQAVMVMVMVITSVHMKHNHHGLSAIAAVISSHVFGMYAFSVLSGRLTDAWGRRPVIAAGSTALAVSCLLAPLSPRVLPLAGALFLLGLGWNFCYVAGSTLLSDQLRPEERATTQGFNDFLIGIASATGALSSGVVFAAVGYAFMGSLAAAAALLPLGLLWLWRLPAGPTPDAEAGGA